MQIKFFISNNITKILSVISFSVCFFFLCVYLFTNYFSFISSQVFGWIFIAFLVICNLPYLTGIITSIVKDKIGAHAMLEAVDQIKDKLVDDPDLINELADKTREMIKKEQEETSIDVINKVEDNS